MGNRVNIGCNSILDVSADICIEDDVALGPNGVIYTHDHAYLQNREIPWKGPITRKGVVIEKGA
ncbi:hypothetical protein [Cesiribacter sp. SM1]|uniref:hypothetical protein n=1 Tax=Cesiribacter sp. SM1 TaxID=2861196 RepID=UPI001CD58C90|nr:hypothetical protein [Cesiribacter sp. SM1]